jgi:hypothetical protein
MSTGSDALGKESQLQEAVTRLRAENRRLLAELERLARPCWPRTTPALPAGSP